jgi:hypothetical protein
MRELGRKGGSVGKGNARRREAALESQPLLELLRTLDPETTKAACEEILAGGNLGAKVQVIRFLADLELYRKDKDPEKERLSFVAAAEEFERRIEERTKRATASLLAGDRDDIVDNEIANELARLRKSERQLLAIPEHVRAEFSVS